MAAIGLDLPPRSFFEPMIVDDYITVEELARRLNYTVKTVRNKVAEGVFKKGVHYSTAPGLPMMFKWSAIIALYQWDQAVECSTDSPSEAKSGGVIRMARGVFIP
jgi:hypothetical protein